MKNKKLISLIVVVILAIIGFFVQLTADNNTIDISSLPAYSSSPYVTVNDNVPQFTTSQMKTTESFVYCGVLKRHLWTERFAQSPKGEFLEVPCSLNDAHRAKASPPPR